MHRPDRYHCGGKFSGFGARAPEVAWTCAKHLEEQQFPNRYAAVFSRDPADFAQEAASSTDGLVPKKSGGAWALWL